MVVVLVAAPEVVVVVVAAVVVVVVAVVVVVVVAVPGLVQLLLGWSDELNVMKINGILLQPTSHKVSCSQTRQSAGNCDLPR